MQQSLKNVSVEDTENEQLAYVTYEDVCRSFIGDTLLAVQAPSGTQLEVPIPEEVSWFITFVNILKKKLSESFCPLVLWGGLERVIFILKMKPHYN